MKDGEMGSIQEIETYKDNRSLNQRTYMLTIVDGNWSQVGNNGYLCYGQLTWEEVIVEIDSAFKQGYQVAINIDEIEEDELIAEGADTADKGK